MLNLKGNYGSYEFVKNCDRGTPCYHQAPPWNVGCNISNPEKMTSNTRKEKNPKQANVELIGFENICSRG